ncbi:S8 family serine peptidase [Clostridium sporogenes]|uniref:Peptidase S8 n=3 Tax=Clostridium TaxID=1485 RepID=A0A0D1BS90_CLOBO|nr:MULTISPECIES: S8 family serine peptidase [Clostridium]MBE6077218.1 peptidase S8 [Clostridium lundense]MCW7998061.1 peptidase S8 [Clostridium sp. cpc1]MDU2832264.1 S8 family serine peptidase [Clostridium botulinum]EDU38468.1 peptidase, S8/S53 family [Clostridium sporogenes ATCC 15579]KIS22647.1 peptidase S8 [Clostridium botulinum B2 450]
MKKEKIFRKFYLLLIGIFIIGAMFIDNNVQAMNKNSEGSTNLVILFNNNIDNDVKNFISESGGKITKEFTEIGGMEVECNSKLIPEIRTYDTVKSIAPNHNIEVPKEKTIDFKDYIKRAINVDNNEDGDLYNEYQWDIKRVTNSGKSFELNSGNHDIVIGIIDSGIKKDHPDLEKNFMGGENFVPKEFNSDKTETGTPNDIEDRVGHGTYVAGNIAANGRAKGVAPNIGFKSYRVFDSEKTTNATIVSSAIIKATNDGVKVINLSMTGYDLKGKCYWTDPDTGIKHDLGDDAAEYELYKRAIGYAIKHKVTVVTAAGNDGLDCSDTKKLTEFLNEKNGKYGFEYEGLTYVVPGTIDGVINVSATGKTDEISAYSNYGKKFIDVAAPGGDFPDLCLNTGISDTGYVFGEGTSISAPKVSAIAGLILCKNPHLKPKDVAKIIYKTSEKLHDNESKEYYGAGLVDAHSALVE